MYIENHRRRGGRFRLGLIPESSTAGLSEVRVLRRDQRRLINHRRMELDVRGAHTGPLLRWPSDLFERGLVTSKGIVTHDFGPDSWAEAFEAGQLD